jgi:hypothetical protein
MSKSKINVIKVPNETVNQPPKAMEFPRMPRMYLELIENKEKIKPTLVNKEYDPDEVATVTSESRKIQNVNQQADEDLDYEEDDNIEIELDNQDDEEELDEDDEEEDEGPESEKKDIENEEDGDEEDIEDQDDEEDLDDEDDAELTNEAGDFRVPPPRGRDKNFIDDNESLMEDDENDEEEEKSRNGLLPVLPAFGGNRNLRENMQMPNYNNDENESVHSGQSRKSMRLTREESIKKNQVREKLKEILRDPPKLSELEQRGEVKTKRTIPNMVGGSIEEEDELKRELLYKFELVKRSYKNVDIPEFNMHSDYKNMNRTYENTLRRVSLDSNVDTYRNYLIAGFMLMEYILGYWLKFDMAGFTQQQILNMNQYERLLIELGEKSYVPDSKKWPVEVRLLGMIILNAVIFIVAKMIMTKTGTSLFGLMNAQQSEFQKNKPKRKMKGPNIDLSSIPDIDEQSA